MALPLSILDLAPITEGSTPAIALGNSLDLARHAEKWGYRRFWLAEHHNMAGIASAATSVVIAHVAGGTRSIRVGAGGIMLPNHSPLVIAEQFGTLEALFPGRIDLGLGRAPGTDPVASRALRREPNAADSFPQDVLELQALLGPPRPDLPIRAVPGTNTRVPLWILGSSLFGAQLAAALGLPFAFASHFAPEHLLHALKLYRANFRPSESLKRPYAIAGINVFAARSDEEGRRLFTSAQQAVANIYRNARGPLPPPIDDIEAFWTPAEAAFAASRLSRSFVGSERTVQRGIRDFADETGADELIVASAIFDHAARLRSYQILADANGSGA
jgi:luciferase family oxidoreductase group 1